MVVGIVVFVVIARVDCIELSEGESSGRLVTGGGDVDERMARLIIRSDVTVSASPDSTGLVVSLLKE